MHDIHTISIFGLGKLGIPMAACFASKGYDVIGVDRDPTRVVAINDGIAPTRVQVAGCGEYRPIVTNPAKGGAAQNRRVEIFLVPMTNTAPTTITNVPTDNIRTTPNEPMK